ncbi:hypothetical protein DPMN_099495 [Dreissena polymorpha]|uniref:Uncharacterized protein n=1 Tax=Dreissena polymorpha TaxID=45954 RepID=A0A9D4LEZ6_DREPO|nr:hypothetical protein DPMN_099495 [Dreissena polymorpha]
MPSFWVIQTTTRNSKFWSKRCDFSQSKGTLPHSQSGEKNKLFNHIHTHHHGLWAAWSAAGCAYFPDFLLGRLLVLLGVLQLADIQTLFRNPLIKTLIDCTTINSIIITRCPPIF